MNTAMRAAGVLLAAAFLCAFPAAAQIPDKFENLQVLPKDISKRDLVDTMKSFCSAIGHFMLGEAYRATDDNPRAKKRLEELGPAPTE